MSDDNGSQRAARPTLKLKSGVVRNTATPSPAPQKVLPRPAAPRGKTNHAAYAGDEYMQRMQADMDALITKRNEPTR